MQNFADVLIAHGEFLAEYHINLQERHCPGEFVERSPDEFVPEDGGGSHRLDPFLMSE